MSDKEPNFNWFKNLTLLFVIKRGSLRKGVFKCLCYNGKRVVCLKVRFFPAEKVKCHTTIGAGDAAALLTKDPNLANKYVKNHLENCNVQKFLSVWH